MMFAFLGGGGRGRGGEEEEEAGERDAEGRAHGGDSRAVQRAAMEDARCSPATGTGGDSTSRREEEEVHDNMSRQGQLTPASSSSVSSSSSPGATSKKKNMFYRKSFLELEKDYALVFIPELCHAPDKLQVRGPPPAASPAPRCARPAC